MSGDTPVGTLFVGCPMWAHRPWIGTWFPATTRPTELLAAYAACCTAVEGNTTFYAIPRATTVQRWLEQTPTTFRFAFKLPRTITHEQRLRGSDTLLASFLERLAPLGERLGPFSVQLPASFGPADLDVLRTFLDTVPVTFAWSVEVRHPDFFDGGPAERALNDLLFERDVDRIVLDSRPLFSVTATSEIERETQQRKPRLPVRAVATGRHPTVRFIGCADTEANPPFWTRWVTTVARWLEAGRSPFVFLHTPDNAASPGLAHRFHDDVRALVPRLAPLPRPTVVADPVADRLL